MGSALAADGARIEFAEHGRADAPALVLVHGITESREAWAPVVPALAEQWRVIAVDLRGHGESERREPYDALTIATDLDSVVRSVAVDAPLLVGHSLGGVVVSAYAGLGFRARGIVDVDQPLALGAFKQALEPLTQMLRGDPEDFTSAMSILDCRRRGPRSRHRARWQHQRRARHRSCQARGTHACAAGAGARGTAIAATRVRPSRHSQSGRAVRPRPARRPARARVRPLPSPPCP